MSERKQTKGFLLGALAGGVVGSITALLLAPKAGKELRQDISVSALKVGDTTVKVAGQVSETTGRIVKQIGDGAVQVAGKTKQAAGTVVTSVRGWRKPQEGTEEVISDSTARIAATNELGEEAISAIELEAGETEVAASKERNE